MFLDSIEDSSRYTAPPDAGEDEGMTEFKEGRYAAESGLEREDNPHEAGSQDFADWDNGWAGEELFDEWNPAFVEE